MLSYLCNAEGRKKLDNCLNKPSEKAVFPSNGGISRIPLTQAMRDTGKSRSTFRRMFVSGKLTKYRFGGTIYVDPAEVREQFTVAA